MLQTPRTIQDWKSLITSDPGLAAHVLSNAFEALPQETAKRVLAAIPGRKNLAEAFVES